MHLVQTFKTVKLFKVPLCEGILSDWTEGKKLKKAGIIN